ncbi:MAG: HD domain-containing protein, partial [Candidatus Puniceispirillaceae bacterium]
SRAFETFLEILTDSETPERVLRLMNESMWLGKFLPDFRRIVGMMQFDMYHSYTVDEHTLKAVGFLGEIEHGHLADVAPLATAIISKINSRRALYVAMLLHDIAKGRGGDHSELGAEVAAQLCPILGLSDEETETVIWLVRYHLLMSNTAFRYDLNDPQTIEDFAEQVQSPERLKLLLCLTVADIQAVGPAIWNGWKASLMRQLYHRAEAVLGGAAPTEVSAQAVSDSIEQLAEALPDWSSDELHSYVDQFYPSYWTNFRLDSHLYHAGLVRRFDSSKDRILIDFKDDESSNSTILCVMASDHPGLFSRIVGSVAISGCSIVNARINTRQDGTILDQFRIQKDRQAVTDPYIKARLSKLIEQSLAGDISLFGQLKEQTAKRSRRVKVMDVPPRIFVTNKRSRTHTVIEVNGPDRPGLLYQIAYHLAQLNLQINSATVSTYGEKAVDVFYVKDVFGLQITKQITQDKIHATLTGIFDS